LDIVCDRGSGSSLLNKHKKLVDIVNAMATNLKGRSVTVKVRTGWDDKKPTTHQLVPMLQQSSKGRIAAIFVSYYYHQFFSKKYYNAAIF
jgi:tRNA-dihydrouridine synthase